MVQASVPPHDTPALYMWEDNVSGTAPDFLKYSAHPAVSALQKGRLPSVGPRPLEATKPTANARNSVRHIPRRTLGFVKSTRAAWTPSLRVVVVTLGCDGHSRLAFRRSVDCDRLGPCWVVCPGWQPVAGGRCMMRKSCGCLKPRKRRRSENEYSCGTAARQTVNVRAIGSTSMSTSLVKAPEAQISWRTFAGWRSPFDRESSVDCDGQQATETDPR